MAVTSAGSRMDFHLKIPLRLRGGGKGTRCRSRRYKALLSGATTYELKARSGGKRRTLARSTRRSKVRCKLREGRRWKLIARAVAASGATSRPAKKRIDLRGACAR